MDARLSNVWKIWALLDQVRSKLVYGESIGQTRNCQSGAAELGFYRRILPLSTSASNHPLVDNTG